MRKFTVESESLQAVFGIQDKNLKFLEERFNSRISARGNQVSVDASDEHVAKIEKIIKAFAKMLSTGNVLGIGELDTFCRMVDEDPDIDLVKAFSSNGIVLPSKKIVRAKTANQKQYVESIRNYDIVVGIGPAGTGKTYLAMAMALEKLNSGVVKRIILCRPALEAGEKLGFLPGDLVEKINPYLRPLYDALYDFTSPEQAQRLIEQGIIEVAPLAFMRGRTLAKAFVILDEAQNTTSDQMKMFLTRLGMDSQAVITGDITQIDLSYKKESGLLEIRDLFKKIVEIDFVYFDEKDVVRHPLVKKIIDAYEKSGTQR